jgi:hypothetical protein
VNAMIRAAAPTMAPNMRAMLSEFIAVSPIPWLVRRPLIILPVAAPRRIAYFAAALCLINAFTISACASAMALLAVVMWSPAATSGNCIDK